MCIIVWYYAELYIFVSIVTRTLSYSVERPPPVPPILKQVYLSQGSAQICSNVLWKTLEIRISWSAVRRETYSGPLHLSLIHI